MKTSRTDCRGRTNLIRILLRWLALRRNVAFRLKFVGVVVDFRVMKEVPNINQMS